MPSSVVKSWQNFGQVTGLLCSSACTAGNSKRLERRSVAPPHQVKEHAPTAPQGWARRGSLNEWEKAAWLSGDSHAVWIGAKSVHSMVRQNTAQDRSNMSTRIFTAATDGSKLETSQAYNDNQMDKHIHVMECYRWMNNLLLHTTIRVNHTHKQKKLETK